MNVTGCYLILGSRHHCWVHMHDTSLLLRVESRHFLVFVNLQLICVLWIIQVSVVVPCHSLQHGHSQNNSFHLSLIEIFLLTMFVNLFVTFFAC